GRSGGRGRHAFRQRTANDCSGSRDRCVFRQSIGLSCKEDAGGTLARRHALRQGTLEIAHVIKPANAENTARAEGEAGRPATTERRGLLLINTSRGCRGMRMQQGAVPPSLMINSNPARRGTQLITVNLTVEGKRDCSMAPQ